MPDTHQQYRIEKDSLGEIKVANDKFWGAQTERSLANFKIGTEKIPASVILAFAQLKRATAIVNEQNKTLDPQIKEAIVAATDAILTGNIWSISHLSHGKLAVVHKVI